MRACRSCTVPPNTSTILPAQSTSTISATMTPPASTPGRRSSKPGVAARVMICDVDETAMNAAQTESPRIAAVRLDVGDRSAVFAAFGKIERELGRIDGLVCGAAIQPRTRVDEMAPEEWRRVISIN